MSHVLAAVIPGPDKPVELREIPEPELEPGAALLKVELSEVCGTDVYLQRGLLSDVRYPFIPGHVTVGRLERIRGRIDDVAGRPLSEGDRVTFLDVHRTCHACYYCLVAKAPTRCPHRRVYGITYGLEDGLTGGWAQKLHLKPGTRCIPMDDVNPETFMAGGCGLPTAMHAVQRSGMNIGDSVLVLGCGPVGLSAIILSQMRGAFPVLCIGAPSHRLDTALAIGAAATCNFTQCDEESRLNWVREHTDGRGADVTIEATGSPEAVVQAMRFTRDAGTVVIAGQYTDHGDVSFNPHHDLNRKQLDVRGCWGSDFSHFYQSVRVMADPRRAEPWQRFPVERFGLSEANDAIEAVAAGRIVKALIDPMQ